MSSSFCSFFATVSLGTGRKTEGKCFALWQNNLAFSQHRVHSAPHTSCRASQAWNRHWSQRLLSSYWFAVSSLFFPHQSIWTRGWSESLSVQHLRWAMMDVNDGTCDWMNEWHDMREMIQKHERNKGNSLCERTDAGEKRSVRIVEDQQ